jgi:hypothetical protein
MLAVRPNYTDIIFAGHRVSGAGHHHNLIAASDGGVLGAL